MEKSFGLGILYLELEKSFYIFLGDEVSERILIENHRILEENLELGLFRSCKIGEISFLKFLIFGKGRLQNFEIWYTYIEYIMTIITI